LGTFSRFNVLRCRDWEFNNTQIITMGAREIGRELAKTIVDTLLA